MKRNNDPGGDCHLEEGRGIPTYTSCTHLFTMSTNGKLVDWVGGLDS